MILIVEGARCSGKTTIAKAVVFNLRKLGLNAEYKKFERASDPIAHMKEKIKELSVDANTAYVVDRFHLTEFVMSIALERLTPSILKRKIQTIDNMLGSAQASVVVLTASQAIMRKRVVERNDGRGFEAGSLELCENLWEDAAKLFWVDYVLDTNTQEQCDFAVEFLTNVCVKGLAQ